MAHLRSPALRRLCQGHPFPPWGMQWGETEDSGKGFWGGKKGVSKCLTFQACVGCADGLKTAAIDFVVANFCQALKKASSCRPTWLLPQTPDCFNTTIFIMGFYLFAAPICCGFGEGFHLPHPPFPSEQNGRRRSTLLRTWLVHTPRRRCLPQPHNIHRPPLFCPSAKNAALGPFGFFQNAQVSPVFGTLGFVCVGDSARGKLQASAWGNP